MKDFTSPLHRCASLTMAAPKMVLALAESFLTYFPRVHTDGEKVQRLFLPSSAVAPSEGGVSIRVLGR